MTRSGRTPGTPGPGTSLRHHYDGGGEELERAASGRLLGVQGDPNQGSVATNVLDPDDATDCVAVGNAERDEGTNGGSGGVCHTISIATKSPPRQVSGGLLGCDVNHKP